MSWRGKAGAGNAGRYGDSELSTLTLVPGEGTPERQRQDYRLQKEEIRRDASIGSTVATMFQALVGKWGDRVALRRKQGGTWEDISWRQFGDAARQVAASLAASGFRGGESACILSSTRPEWMYCDMGLLGIGMVVAGIYPTDSSSQVAYLTGDCNASIIFVENDAQLDKVLAIRETLPALRLIVVFDLAGLRDLADDMVCSFADFLLRGAAFLRAQPDWFARQTGKVLPDSLAILVYTSGTTGPPKGAMVSHANLVFQVVNSAPLWEMHEGDDRLAFLPLCHIAERYFTYFSMYRGVVSNFVESPATVLDDVREVQPEFMLAVPRIWEKLYSQVDMRLKEGTRLRRWAFGCAMALGMRRERLAAKGVSPPAWLELALSIADPVVLRGVRTSMGLERARSIASGGAPISPELVQWYGALGIVLLELYGMTECGTISANLRHARRLGSVGRPAGGCRVRIAENGEILVRGANVFVGYLNQESKTAEVLRDGWLHTGDVGRFDDDGYLYITDRLKDILITSGGKNITPSEIQNALKFSSYISDALVIGDRRKYLTAIIMIDRENVEKFAQEAQLAYTDFASLVAVPQIRMLIGKVVEAVNAKFARVESIKDFRILPVELTPAHEEVTPTMKLKRRVIERKWESLIESMYEGASL